MLHKYIEKRKSIRRYKMDHVSNDVFEKVETFIKTIKPLFPLINVSFKIKEQGELLSLFPVKSPYYVFFYSEKKEHYLLNAGFMMQQLELYFQSIGIGCCYLGAATPVVKKDKDGYVIAMAWGLPEETMYRTKSQFNRLPLSEIGKELDSFFDVVRLAPSSTNSQPWYIEQEEDGYRVYRKELSSFKKIILDKLQQIDIGIALCHLYLSATTFAFIPGGSDKEGLLSMGKVILRRD